VANSQYPPTAAQVGGVGCTDWLYIGPPPPQAVIVTPALGEELEEEFVAS
jgi:hypothetical protein